MVEERRTRRWHECLSAIKVPFDAPDAEMQERFKKGKQAHYQIEAILKGIKDEEAKTYSDGSLPFDVIYHADLFDTATGTVYDIKPAAWLANNLYYCLCQLSGYKFFLGARAMGFVQYARRDGELQGPWVSWVPSELVVPWSHLREIALKSDERLLADERTKAPEENSPAGHQPQA